MKINDNKYFADEERYSKKLVAALENKIQKDKELRTFCGIDAVQYRNRLFYYAALNSGTFDSGLDFSGTAGELIESKSNQMRSLCRQFLALATKQRLDFEVHSDTTESANLTGSRLANSLVKHVISKQKLDLLADQMAELCLLDGDSYIGSFWNPGKGKLVQEGVFSGDLEMSVIQSSDVVFEGNDFYKSDWCIIRSEVNKFDLIAEYPDLEKEIKKAEQVGDSDELVYQYAFYHLSTPAMPGGRITLFTSAECVFFDSPNPYPHLPLSQMKPEPIHGSKRGSKFGYSMMNDLVPLQELHDLALNTASSNVGAYGLGMMLNPEGNGLSWTDIGGIRFMNYKPQALGGGAPSALQLPSTPSEVYRFSDTSKAAMMELSGISGTIRGNPPANVTSGAFAAILSAQAVEASQPFSKAYFLCLEDAMYKAVQCYKLFAKFPQMLSIVGLNKSSQIKEFVGDDIGEVSKITLRVTSPLLQTTAGLSDVSEKLLQAGLLKTRDEYLQFIQTGNLDVMTDAPLNELDFIRRENDLLSEGKKVKALVTDTQGQHILSHKGVLNDPDLRARAAAGDPEAMKVVQAVSDHLLEHFDLLKGTDPAFITLLQTGQMPQPPQSQIN